MPALSARQERHPSWQDAARRWAGQGRCRSSRRACTLMKINPEDPRRDRQGRRHHRALTEETG